MRRKEGPGHMSRQRAARSGRVGVGLVVLSLLAVTACERTSGIAGVSEERELEIQWVGGEGQEAVVGQVLDEPLVVAVVDQNGTPVPGVEVEWIFEKGHGAGSQGAASGTGSLRIVAETDRNGLSVAWWQLGTEAGEQSASVGLLGDTLSSAGGPSAAPGRRWRRWVGFFARAWAARATTIRVSPAAAEVAVGEDLMLTAVVTDVFGNAVEDQSVEWSSMDDAVATVDGSGAVQPAQEGATEIVARSSQLSGAASVQVVDATVPDPTDPPVARVVAGPDTIRIHSVGGTEVIQVRAESSTGEEVQGVTFSFESSNSSIVGVSSMGRLNARAVGTALIAVSALCCDASDSIVVVVDDVPQTIAISVDGSSISVDTLRLQTGQNAALSAEALNDIGNVIGGVDIDWASSNPSVASVNGAGQVTAQGPGVANITASAEGLTAVMPTVVTEPSSSDPVSLRVGPASFTLTGVGSTRQLSLTARDASGSVVSTPQVAWETSNPSVATVNSSGTVTARGIGTAIITAVAACCSSEPSQVTVPGAGWWRWNRRGQLVLGLERTVRQLLRRAPRWWQVDGQSLHGHAPGHHHVGRWT